MRLALVIALAGCGDVVGFGGDPGPLATVDVAVTGDPMAAQPKVALVWGAQFLIEPLCILPAESPEVAAVLAQGCRDPFGFIPDRIAATVDLAPDGTAQLPLYELPSADVMVGDVTARVAYGSLVVYDDVDGNGTLDLARPQRPRAPDDNMDPPPDRDIVHGASFVSMTEADQRLAFREGAFITTAFYPRAGCGDPLPAFSVLSAGGFSGTDAIAAALQGKLPQEDPASCAEAPVEAGPVSIAIRPPDEVAEVNCSERRVDSSTRYRDPPIDPLDLTNRVSACAKLPDFGGGDTSGVIQLLVSTRSDRQCRGLTHYILRGCDNDPLCEMPEWDLTATPPAWWPCPVGAP